MVGAIGAVPPVNIQQQGFRGNAPGADNDNARSAPNVLDAENPEGLTPEEQNVVRELKQIDSEVRAHEQAHKNVAGPYAGPIQYQTVTGPDGREYAVGGSVSIDTSPVPGNPEATIRKLEIVIRAALAPAQPSSQDFAVARAAQQAKLQAQREANEERQAELAEARGESEGTGLQAFLERELALRGEETNQGQNGPAEALQAIQNLQRAASLIS